MRKSYIFLLLVLIFGINISIEAQEIEYVNSILWTGINDLQVVDNYAFCAFQNGLVVMDISDPQNPRTLSKLYLPGESKGILVSGSNAFIAGGSDGLFIVGISDPTFPVLLGRCDTPYDARRVFISGNFAYVSDFTDGLMIIDFTDRQNPVLISQYLPEDFIEGVFVAGDYAFVAISSSGLDIVDISDRSNPVLVANFDDTLYHATDVFINDNIAYIAENSSDFRIVDVTDPAHPIYVGREWYHLRAKDIEIADDFAYTVNPEFGVEIYDIADPFNIIHLAEFPLSSQYLTYLHLSNNSVYVLERGVGFHMIDISEPSGPVYQGLYQQGSKSFLVDGKYEYAFVKYDSGIKTIDLTDPYNPTVIGDYEITGFITDIYLNGNYLYVFLPQHISIYDVSDPANLAIIGGCSVQGGIRDHFESGSYIYVTYTSNSFGIIDCSDPSNPHTIGRYDTPGIRMGIGAANGIAFVQAWSVSELYDVGDPENIFYIGNFENSVGTEMYAAGDYLFATEVPGIRIIDVTDRENPGEIGYCNISGLENLYIGENYAVASLGELGVKLIDISDFADPTITASFDTPGDASDAYVSGQNVIVADGSSVMVLRVSSTGIDDFYVELPNSYTLAPAYPNPFNNSTTIRYDLPVQSDVLLEIYDILGRKVETLVSGMIPAGRHAVVWDADKASSGVYFYKILTPDFSKIGNMTLLK